MGIHVQPKIIKLNPLSDSIESKDGKAQGNSTADALGTISPLVANKILESMSTNEIRDIISLSPIVNGDAVSTGEKTV